MLLEFLIVAILIFSCLGLYDTPYIYLFKFDIICLSIIDYIAYTYAWNELHPKTIKKGMKDPDAHDSTAKPKQSSLMDAIMGKMDKKTKDEEDDIVELHDSKISKNTANRDDVFYDEDGEVVGRTVNKKLIDNEGREIQIDSEENRILQDENEQVTKIYTKDGRLIEENGFKIEKDKK